VLLRFNY